MINSQKSELVACCNTKETQRATNSKNNATNSATINATNNLKALAGAVLQRNQLSNDSATHPLKTMQLIASKNDQLVAQNPLEFQGKKELFLTVLDKKIILTWLNHIGEQNPEMINDVLSQCANSPEALAYYLKRSYEITEPLHDLFDDRHYCRECQNLNWQGRCTASKTRYTPVDTHPRRCADFVERGVKND